MSNGESAPAPEARATAPAPPRNAGYRDRLFRVIILVAVLGSVAVIWWSFGRVLSPRQQQSRELSLQVARLSAEVDDLDRQWTQAQMANVTNQFSQVDFTLFEGRAGVEAWVASLKELTASLALDVGVDLGQPSQQTAGEAVASSANSQGHSGLPELATASRAIGLGSSIDASLTSSMAPPPVRRVR